MCSLHCDGSPHNGAADTDGVIFPGARRRKERRYPELVGPVSRAHLVVLALDVAVVDGVVHIHLSVGEGKASPAEEG